VPRSTPKAIQPATVKLTLTLTNELKEALIKKAHDMFGNRKGAISTYVEMTLRNDLQLSHPQVEEA
jgi:hypothetical protein